VECDPARRLVIVVPARLLRRENVRLSVGLSWERTVEHLLTELEQNPVIQPLRMARHLIVTFEGDGAIWIDRGRSNRHPLLVFDSAHAEGEWSSRIEGGAFGYQTCITAALVRALVSTENLDPEPDFGHAIERGLSAIRTLREEGHGMAWSSKGIPEFGRGFPHARLAEAILRPTHRYASAKLPRSSDGLSTWSILAALQNPSAPRRPLFGFARQLTLQGDSLLDHVPHFRIAKLIEAGRVEMETLRSLRRIMVAYRDPGGGKRPLSIGVFGQPGSGKSFAVEQLAIGVYGEPQAKSYEGWMEFNLSQFDDASDLIGAFHQVRDRALRGVVPVVFWDEFDSDNYKWLRFLLAPMQDGRFQEKNVTHPLGRCVFLLAGGTAHTFAEFGPPIDDAAYPAFKRAKGPDFKSRLDGYLNVLGPNSSGRDDTFYPVRRALMIRNLLGCAPDERIDIDDGLLTALLEVQHYTHGARSLGKVLDPFSAARKKARQPLRRSQLPAPNQLSLHVNAPQFHALCSRDTRFLSDDIVDELARAIHATWRKIAQSEGWKPRYDLPFEKLPSDIKRSNFAAARRIPGLLALIGLRIVPGRATRAQETLVRDHIEFHIASLAEEEHRGWMSNAESEGWQFNEVRDDDKKLHDCLIPFHELRELDQEKDRHTVRHFPDFVRKAGFKIQFTSSR
jgi:hypothetical protein